MNASKAKKLTESRAPKFDIVYETIRSAAEKAEYSVVFNLDDQFSKFSSVLIRELRKDGFDVHHNQGEDRFNGEVWNNLKISWK